jgi:multidrug efflux pump subunit AcrA (membrane-fusion protein)
MKTSRFTVRRSRYLVIAALALCCVAIGGLLLSASPSHTRPPQTRGQVEVERARDVICLGFVDVEGGVSQLAPAEPGRVVEVAAREGAFVAKGAILVRQDDTPAQFKVQEGEAALSLAETQLAQA